MGVGVAQRIWVVTVGVSIALTACEDPPSPILFRLFNGNNVGTVPAMDSGPDWYDLSSIYGGGTITESDTGYSVADGNADSWNFGSSGGTGLHNYGKNLGTLHPSANRIIPGSICSNFGDPVAPGSTAIAISGATSGATYQLRVFYGTSYSGHPASGSFEVLVDGGSVGLGGLNPLVDFGLNACGMVLSNDFAAVGTAINLAIALDGLDSGSIIALELIKAGSIPRNLSQDYLAEGL